MHLKCESLEVNGRTLTGSEFDAIDGVTATAAELNILDDVCSTVAITLAASVTTDGMDITFTVKDAAGVAIDAVHRLEWWISESATGQGLTADTYSGDVTTGTGTELAEITSKKHFIGLTNASGVMVATAVASANPSDQYVVCAHPVTGKLIVSAVSGTNWEGA